MRETSLEEEKDEKKLVDDAHGKHESPNDGVRSGEWPIWHNGHAQSQPKVEGGQKSSLRVVVCPGGLVRLEQGDVN